MSTEYAPGLHVVAGKATDAVAYDRWVGRWSRLFVPSLLSAARVSPGCTMLDVATGTGEAALTALSIAGSEGLVVGSDIAVEMLESARHRLDASLFRTVAADGQALPFKDSCFDAVVCQLGLQFFPDPAKGLMEFRRVLRPGAWASVCVFSTPDKSPSFGILAEALSDFLPERREQLHLTWALGDQVRFETLFANAGFRDIHVARETRADTMESFEEYWAPIETGTGQQPQIYRALPEADRRSVRERVRKGLARFETDGKLSLSVEMLIGRGQA
jgi:SAM-dependent methyltransferase